MESLVTTTRISLRQRAKLTLGIAALGGIAGAVAGGISALVVAAVIDRNALTLLDPFLLKVGAEIGAPLGALLLPIAAWTLLRHVSFGRAFVGSIAGTLIGGLIGWFIVMDTSSIFRSIAGGAIGFCVAAVLLRLRARSSRAATS